jgi:hypothetical protein
MLKDVLTDDQTSDEDVSPRILDTASISMHVRQQYRHPGQLNLSSSRGNSPSGRRVMNVCKNCEVSFFDAEFAKGISNEYCTKGEREETNQSTIYIH